MLSFDLIIAVAYATALLITKKMEYFICFILFVISLVVATTIKDNFSVSKGGIECLYFLGIGSLWIYGSSYLAGKNYKLSMILLIMGFYEFLCSIESFIWQFVLPVLTPVIEYYSYNVIMLHALTLISVYRWGVKIEGNTSYIIDNFNARIHH